MTFVTTEKIVLPVKPALVIFDCDGVLVNSEPIANHILAESLTAEGYACTFEESVIRFLGRDLPAIIQEVERKLGQQLSDGFFDRLRANTYAAFRKHLKPVTGIDAALDCILFPKCVASSGPPEKIRLSLDLTELRHHFGDALFSATQVPRGKPHPDLFFHAARHFGVRPEECVVVEDSVPGVIGAKAAGMAVLGYAGGDYVAPGHSKSLVVAGAKTFCKMDVLPDLLEDLFR